MFFTSTVVVFTKAELKALATHASKDVTRPQIAHVVVDPEHHRAWATDGHRIVVVASGACELVATQWGIAADDVRRMMGAASRKAPLVHVSPAGWFAAVGRQPAAPSDNLDAPARLRSNYKPFVPNPKPGENTFAAFPAVDHAIVSERRYSERKHATSCVVFNAKLIADITLVCAAAGVQNVKFYPGNDALDPMLLCVGPDWSVTLMPARM